MRFILVVLFACAPITVCAQASKHPITHVDACEKFSRAVVRIDSLMSGTGFIVSPDGWILTAGHLVINSESRANAVAISVVMPDKSVALATQVLKIDDALLLRDFALLK